MREPVTCAARTRNADFRAHAALNDPALNHTDSNGPNERAALTALGAFVADERGGITVFNLVLFVLIVLTTGVALDLLRHESERAELQDALDRGVLAAASLSQTASPDEIVQSYVNKTTTYVHSNVVTNVGSADELNYRRVEASADYDIDTTFLRLAGLKSLPVVAGAIAEESREEVEISLVLDISGSMARERTGGTENSRLSVLRTAASSFIDQILTEETVPHTSLSLIPYSGQVNAGPLFDYYNLARVHSNSSCIEFQDVDFAGIGLPAPNTRTQAPHFQWFTFEGDRGYEAEWGWCPTDAQALVPLSNDPVYLKQRIQSFVGHDGTGTQIGMKWGVGLLDPDSAPAIDYLVANGVVDSRFDDRPHAFGEDRVLKVVVLMTDGNTRYQQRPIPAGWLLNSSSLRTIDETLRVQQVRSLCTKAKDEEIVVFTIGFDLSPTSTAYTEMANCATSAAHFFHVNGLELDTAFRQIAATIKKLKLVG